MFNSLQQPLYVLGDSTSYRVSSWDKSGKNADFITLQPGQSCALAELEGPGCIKHFWCAMMDVSPLVYRKIVLRIWWDDEQIPSVEVPLGDFFCISNCVVRPVNSLMMAVNPGGKDRHSYGLNCYFPMPFAKGARMEVEYQAAGEEDKSSVRFWYHIEVERTAQMSLDNIGYFHAQWCRENLTKSNAGEYINRHTWPGENLNGAENYIILEARGQGQVVGLHLQVDNIAGGWYGEGDDMIFIDGERWPPSYAGTGTEEIFGSGGCPNVEYSSLYTGFHLITNPNFSGKNAMYRWYIHDPIKFKQSVRMTIEHGHANNFENDYSSVAYWYQLEPHAPFPQLLPVKQRLPRFPETFFIAEQRIDELNQWREQLREQIGHAAPEIVGALRSAIDRVLREDLW